MEVIQKSTRNSRFRFRCPNCISKLQVEGKEIFKENDPLENKPKYFNGDIFRFTCPVCKKEVPVQFMDMERYMVMENGLEVKY